MEDFILNLIGSYAFPIVMCIALFWKMDKQDTEHKAEIDKISSALDNNTVAIVKLVEHMKEGD